MSRQGTRIGPYALEMQLTRARGYGLWRAARADGKSRGPDKVAVRLLDDPGDGEALARLEREYRRLQQLEGTGAPLPVAFFGGFGALVMELCQGATLHTLLEAAGQGAFYLDDATALEVALGLARVLRVGHGAAVPVVHGRLAPGEILLGSHGELTLLGWGGWSPQVWTAGTAPEVVRGQAPLVASDLWALGALLATMLEPETATRRGMGTAQQGVARRWPAAGRLLESLLVQREQDRDISLDRIVQQLLSLSRRHGGVARIGELVRRSQGEEPAKPRVERPREPPAEPESPTPPVSSAPRRIAPAPAAPSTDPQPAPTAAPPPAAKAAPPAPVQPRELPNKEPPEDAAQDPPPVEPGPSLPLKGGSVDPTPPPPADDGEKAQPMSADPEDGIEDPAGFLSTWIERAAAALVVLLVVAVLVSLARACFVGA